MVGTDPGVGPSVKPPKGRLPAAEAPLPKRKTEENGRFLKVETFHAGASGGKRKRNVSSFGTCAENTKTGKIDLIFLAELYIV